MDLQIEEDGSSEVSLSFVFDADTPTSEAQGPGHQGAQQLTSSDYNFYNNGYGYYGYYTYDTNMSGNGIADNSTAGNLAGNIHFQQQHYCFHGQPQIESEQSSVITTAPGYLHHTTITNQMGNMRPPWFNGPGELPTTSNTATHTNSHSMVLSTQQQSFQAHGGGISGTTAPTFPNPLMPNQQLHFGSNWFGCNGDQPPSYFNKGSVIRTHNTSTSGTQSQPIVPAMPPPNVSLTRPRATATHTKKIRPLWVGQGEPPIYPRGLEVLWREVPPDCQKLINPSDVPPTARYRGYFTVSELLILKRVLIGRLYGVELKPLPPSNCNGRATSRRTHRSVSAAASATVVVSDSPPLTDDGVGEAVKEALGILGETQNGSGNNNNQGQNLNLNQNRQE